MPGLSALNTARVGCSTRKRGAQMAGRRGLLQLTVVALLLGAALPARGAAAGSGGAPTPARAPAPPAGEIDDGLYSRQLYTIGRDAQLRVSQSAVLVTGLRATGAEVAKNLALAGVRALTLHDDEPVGWADLSGNYCLDEAHMGRARSHAVRPALAALNPQHVDVRVHDGPLTAEALRAAGVAVLVAADLDHAEEVRLDELCRACGVLFVSGCGRGVFGRVFCDFGRADGAPFVVEDTDGEAAREVHIQQIRADGTVELAEGGAPHGLSRGDSVRFRGVVGLEGVNADEGGGAEAGGAGGAEQLSFEVQRVRGRRAFCVSAEALAAAAPGGAYVRGGVATRVKRPAALDFGRLADVAAREALPLVRVEGERRDARRERTVHACFCALGAAGAEGCGEEAEGTREAAFLAAARALAEAGGREGLFDAELAARFFQQARASVRPMAALLGGLAAQEALKACTHRWSPLCQFFYYDAAACLAEEPLRTGGGAAEEGDATACLADESLREGEGAGEGDRLCGQRAAIGPELSAALARMRLFVVGAGAIGCELLKNLAGMGVALEGAGGCVSVTDMDLIERSNLNRQLLFREADIGKPKAACAAEACGRLNPRMRVRPAQLALGADTARAGGAFDEPFWRQLDAVLTALDNVGARLLADELSVRYGVPLLDSGTLGAKGSVQPSVPRVSESYGASADPAEGEGEVPQCTLKAFPFAPEHCVAWAREQLDAEFGSPVGEALRFAEDEGAFVRQHADERSEAGVDTEGLGDALRRVVATLEGRPETAAACVRRGLALFAERFDASIRGLLAAHPPGHADEDGQPFWRGSKRMPAPLAFDAREPAHADLVRAAARLYARAYGVQRAEATALEDEGRFARLLAEADAERQAGEAAEAPGAAESGAGGAPGEGGDQAELGRLVAEAEALLARADELRAHLPAGRLLPLEFEKDDDANGHVDFILAASNLRADNYAIARVDRLACKGLAGRIVPAIATTTAVVSALVCFELLKLARAAAERAAGRAPEPAVERARLRSTFVNLALPLVASTEPLPPAPRGLPIAGLEGLTEWDVLELDAPAAADESVAGLVARLEALLGGARVLALACADTLLFSALLPCAVPPERRVLDAIGEASPAPYVHAGRGARREVRLSVTAARAEGEPPLSLPLLAYRWTP